MVRPSDTIISEHMGGLLPAAKFDIASSSMGLLHVVGSKGAWKRTSSASEQYDANCSCHQDLPHSNTSFRSMHRSFPASRPRAMFITPMTYVAPMLVVVQRAMSKIKTRRWKNRSDSSTSATNMRVKRVSALSSRLSRGASFG